MTISLPNTKQPELSLTISRHAVRIMVLIAATAMLTMCGRNALAGNPNSCYTSPPKILVLRGVFEVFSLGMNDLAQKLACRGYDVKATSWSLALLEAQCEDNRPYVVIGHSLGGRMCAWTSRKLMSCGKRVPLIIIVDANVVQRIPANVDRCVHLYVTNPLGIFHGSPVRAESPCTEIVNWDVSRGQPSMFEGGVNHFNIDATPWVHQIIINEIERMFPRSRDMTISRRSDRPADVASRATPEISPPSLELPPSLPTRRQIPWEASRPEITAPESVQQPRSLAWKPERIEASGQGIVR